MQALAPTFAATTAGPALRLIVVCPPGSCSEMQSPRPRGMKTCILPDPRGRLGWFLSRVVGSEDIFPDAHVVPDRIMERHAQEGLCPCQGNLLPGDP